MQELFKKVSERLRSVDAKRPFFTDKNYIPIDITKENFKDIPTINNNKKIAFIDGGNIEIIGNNNFSFQLMRIYWTIYEDNKRKKTKQSDYFVLINTTDKEDQLIYQAEIYSGSELVDTIDYTLTKNNEQLKPENIINTTRRIYEIRAITESAKELDQDSLIVLDGNLCTKDKLENDELEKAYQVIEQNNLLLAAVSKTSSMLTDTGSNLIGFINNISKDKTKWSYFPICENNNKMHNAEMIIARLHEISDYAFVIDIHKDCKDKIPEICSSLAYNSKDPVFLGYPYGLVEADQFARCQEYEKKFLQTRFLQSSRENFAQIRRFINTNNAHDVLDSIN